MPTQSATKPPGDDQTETQAVTTSSAPLVGFNQIHLLGRLADTVVERVLPSGDALVTFRLVVPRPAEPRPSQPGRRAPTIDTVDCVAWGSRERQRLLSQTAGCNLEVWGALRRRFYRGPGGLGSRYEVSVDRVASVKVS